MGIPDYDTAMLPVLQYLADVTNITIGEVVEDLAQQLHLSIEERAQVRGSGQSANDYSEPSRMTETYLKKAGLIVPTRRGFLRIFEQGRSALEWWQSRRITLETHLLCICKSALFSSFETSIVGRTICEYHVRWKTACVPTYGAV